MLVHRPILSPRTRPLVLYASHKTLDSFSTPPILHLGRLPPIPPLPPTLTVLRLPTRRRRQTTHHGLLYALPGLSLNKSATHSSWLTRS